MEKFWFEFGSILSFGFWHAAAVAQC